MDPTLLGLIIIGVPVVSLVAVLVRMAFQARDDAQAKRDARWYADNPPRPAPPARLPPARPQEVAWGQPVGVTRLRDLPLPPYQPPDSMTDPEVGDRFPIVVGDLRLPVEFIYQHPARGVEPRMMTVRAVRLRVTRDGQRYLYLDGYCHDRRAPRMFRHDRITQLADLTTGEVVEGEVAILAWIGERTLGVARGKH